MAYRLWAGEGGAEATIAGEKAFGRYWMNAPPACCCRRGFLILNAADALFYSKWVCIFLQVLYF